MVPLYGITRSFRKVDSTWRSVYIGDLALIQGNKEILSAFVHVFRHLVAAQLDHIVIRIRLACLFRGYHTLKQPLGSRFPR